MELQAEPWGHVGYISPSLVCRVVWGGLAQRGRGDCISSDILSGHTHTVDTHLYPVSLHYL